MERNARTWQHSLALVPPSAQLAGTEPASLVCRAGVGKCERRTLTGEWKDNSYDSLYIIQSICIYYRRTQERISRSSVGRAIYLCALAVQGGAWE